MKKGIILLLLTILLVANVQGISNTITYMVEDADYGGSARNGLFNTTISYCDAQSGGNKIYNFTVPFLNYTSSEAFIDVNITSDLNFNQDLWIETVVNGTTYARKKVSSNLNTYEANNTQKLGGYDSSLFARNNTGTWNLDINSTTICVAGLCISTWDAVNGSAVDTNLNETEVENYIFDNDNTGSMITSGDITSNAINVSYIYSKFSATGMDIRADPWYLSNAGFEVSAGKDFCINGGVCLSSVDTNTDTNTLYTADNIYIYNSTNTMTLNETKLNATIDARDTDTTYSDLSEFNNDVNYITNETRNKSIACTDIYGGSDGDFCIDTSGAGGDKWIIDIDYLYNDSTKIYFNETKLNATIIIITDARDTDTTYSALSEFDNDEGFFNTEANLTTLLDDNYADIGVVDTDTHVEGDGLYLTNDSTTMTFDESKMNDTIDARDTDTNTQLSPSDVVGYVGNWSDDSGDYYTSTQTDTALATQDECSEITGCIEETDMNATIIIITDARDTDTTYSALSEFDNDEGFYNTEANLTTLLDGNYADISVVDTDTDTHVAGDQIYIYNTTTMSLNETKLNATIDARDTDTNTEYTANGLYVYLDTLDITINETQLNLTIIAITDARDTDTTYSALSEFDNDEGFFNTEANLTTLLDDNYADISVTDTTYTAGDGITLTGTEFNTTYQTNQDTGTGDGVTFSSAQLTSALTVANGGTGTQSFTDGGILFGDGTGDIDVSAQFPSGTILVGVAEGTNPTGVMAFTSHNSGTLKHEFGGMEADVSGYSDGLYGMISGATADIDTLAELNTAIGVSLITNDTRNTTASDLSCSDCIDGTEISELSDADISNTLTCNILTDDDTYALTGSAETFDENIVFAKNITITECAVFGNGATWCGII